MARPFRFSARMPELKGDTANWRDSLKQIEDAGFSTVAVPDHFTQGSVWEPFVTLMAAAGATSTLRLLPLVAGNDYRHPVMLHKAAASLEALSDGRLELGIGAGWMISDYEAAGMPYDEPGVRVSRFEESVQIVKGLFAEEPLTYEGRYYKITALDGLPKPVQKPHPPILIGGGGKRVLSIAAREADIISVNANLKDGAVGPGAA
ncbi:MAG TPA: LLM class flavin-dependent oxidoreductase, partial [Dehalococcoidia bacterium]|nr:LLM class flavin-dependent oxidoreductase [Dehalococcoidia bacterium]